MKYLLSKDKKIVDQLIKDANANIKAANRAERAGNHDRAEELRKVADRQFDAAEKLLSKYD